MSTEIARMRSRLAMLKRKKSQKENEFHSLAIDIREGINPMLKDHIEDMEIPVLSEMWGELEVCWAEILSLRSDIERLSKELEG